MVRALLAATAILAVAACSSPPGGAVTEFVSLSAPDPGIVAVVAHGLPGKAPATSDGADLGTITLVKSADDTVSGSIESSVYGAQTFCVRDTCGRVWVKDPSEQTQEHATATAQAALDGALATYGISAALPDWTFVVTGPLAGVGGSTSRESHTVTIHATPGRTPADYVVTVLHEVGHVVDAEYLDDAHRAAYLDARGIPADSAWHRSVDDHVSGDDRWLYGAEDFAEVMAWILSAGEHVPRTGDLADAPEPEDAAVIVEIVFGDAGLPLIAAG